jgi:hypothetical protein
MHYIAMNYAAIDPAMQAIASPSSAELWIVVGVYLLFFSVLCRRRCRLGAAVVGERTKC